MQCIIKKDKRDRTFFIMCYISSLTTNNIEYSTFPNTTTKKLNCSLSLCPFFTEDTNDSSLLTRRGLLMIIRW